MPTDLIIKSEDLAVALNVIGEILKADGNNQGGCGFLRDRNGVLHILVQDVNSARRVLESNKLLVSEERNVWVLIAEHGDNAILKLNGVKEDDPDNLYTLKVPEDGVVEINTHIASSEDNTQEPRGCGHIIFDLLHSLGLTK